MAGSARRRGLSRGRSAPVVFAAAVTGATAGLFLVSRGRWSDALIDSGREWIVPDALARGDVLYRDAVCWFGPLTPHVQAVFLRAFGSNYASLVQAGAHGVGKPDPERPGREKLPDLDLVRLAVPRRVYTNVHLEYVAEVVVRLHRKPQAIRGVQIVREAAVLRHFSGRFELI